MEKELITEYTDHQNIDQETGEVLIDSEEQKNYLEEDKLTSPLVKVKISEVKTEDSILNNSI